MGVLKVKSKGGFATVEEAHEALLVYIATGEDTSAVCVGDTGNTSCGPCGP